MQIPTTELALASSTGIPRTELAQSIRGGIPHRQGMVEPVGGQQNVKAQPWGGLLHLEQVPAIPHQGEVAIWHQAAKAGEIHMARAMATWGWIQVPLPSFFPEVTVWMRGSL